ncbi:MAG: GTPase Era [candidate division WOR-3 bacterium]|nr:GTPase Era [candidate division WOR-3 bacterium]
MKSGYVTIAGRPNTGKSTLLNRILNIKLSAVTHKAQTTRSRILGIYNDENTQIVFFDTPGMIKPENSLQSKMVKDIDRSISDCDLLILMTDDINYMNDYSFITKRAENFFIILNKTDRMDEAERENALNELSGRYIRASEVIPLSALKGHNIDLLVEKIRNYLPHSHHFYPEDYLTDKPERFFVSELIREQVFLLYGQELPYSSGVVVEEFKEREDSKTYIRVNIYVERNSQKGIIIGAGGKKIRELGIKARKSIEEFLGRKIYLDLNVKYKKNWKNNLPLLERMWNI